MKTFLMTPTLLVHCSSACCSDPACCFPERCSCHVYSLYHLNRSLMFPDPFWLHLRVQCVRMWWNAYYSQSVELTRNRLLAHLLGVGILLAPRHCSCWAFHIDETSKRHGNFVIGSGHHMVYLCSNEVCFHQKYFVDTERANALN